jgi:hypothetical protein
MEIEIARLATVLSISEMNILGGAIRDVTDVMDESVNSPKPDGWGSTPGTREIFKFADFKSDLRFGKITCIFPTRASIWGIFWTVHKTLLGEFPPKGYV